MITRRDAILLSIGLPAAFRGLPAWAFAKEFWNEKKPEDWSAEEIDMLLNRSPWARDVNANMKAVSPEGGESKKKGGGYSMSGGAGGRSASTGGSGGGSGSSSKNDTVIGSFRGLVRWESAEPVLLAQKKEGLTGEAAEHYIISVSGLPMAGARKRAGDESDPDAEEIAARIIDATRLTPQHRDPILPVKVDASKPSRGTLLYFRRDAEQFTLDHKEVTFATKLGPLEVKTKFQLKEMMYRGKLAV